MKRAIVSAALLAVILCAAPLLAQESRATISGAVLDPTGAAVPNAKVVATEVRTGVSTPTMSDNSGQYNLPFLPPGQYTLKVDAAGFKSFIRTGIQLSASDHPIIDITLQIGQASDAVTVTAEAPLIDIANAATGQTISTRQVEDFPLNGRNPMMVAQLALGVVATATPGLVHPFDNGAASAWSIGGTPSQTAEILMDGAPNATWDNRVAYAPAQEAVQEVKVKAFETDASFGHTSSGTINQIMKTGTNDLHGSGYWFTQPSSLAANSWLANNTGSPKQDTKLNQYGLTLGGPVLLPKVYNGRNKLFWFFSWENESDAQPNPKLLTVPTDAERSGDFSSLLALGSQYQIYNPYGSKVDSKKVVTRVPFYCDASGNPMTPILTPGATYGTQAVGTPCNKLPSQLLNPVALKYLQFYPEPNVTGKNTGYSNYSTSATTNDSYNNELGRLDWNMSEKSRFSFNVRHNYQVQSKNDYFNNAAAGLASMLTRENWGGSADEVYTLNTSTVLDVRLNYTRMIENHPSPSAGFDPSSLGFPSYINSNSQLLSMPAIVFGNCGSDSTQATSFDCLGQTGASILPSQSMSLFADVVKQMSRHTLKFGVDVRDYKLDAQTYGASSGTYTFGGFGTTNGWTQSASNGSPAPFGQDFASFLLGLPTSGSLQTSARGTYDQKYYAVFINDDWRVKSNLTLNLGIRYDHDTPYSEKLGRTVNGFDFTSANPISAAATTAFKANTASSLPAGYTNLAFAVPGGLTFASPSNTNIWDNTSHLVSPRVGFAWSPSRFHDKTVIRGGFGLFVQPTSLANLNPTGSYSSTPVLTQSGFSQTTPVQVPSVLQTPSPTLSDPFATGFLAPTGASAGLATFLGQSVTFIAPQAKNPYSERWTFGIQQSLNHDTMLEIAYIGNHSVHLPITFTQLNGIPRQYLSTLPNRDGNLNTTLTGSVTNPFAGLIPSVSSFNGSTINLRQLLPAFPEFPVADSTSFSSGVVEQNLNIGSSNYNGLDVRVEKRMSHGLQLVGNFIWSKLIEQDSWLNNTDTTPERRISPFDHTLRFVTGINYDLPIGQGKLLDLGHRWLNSTIGGWRVNAMYTYQTGAPILWMNGSTNNPGDYAFCSARTAQGTNYKGALKGLCTDENGNLLPPAVFTNGSGLATLLNYDPRQTNGTAFNTAQFVTGTTPSTSSGSTNGMSAAQLAVVQNTGQYVFHLRSMPTTFSNLRQDPQNFADASVVKQFDLREGTYFQFRAEAFNLFNHPNFAAPNLQPTSSSFGTITNTANRARQLQLALRFVF